MDFLLIVGLAAFTLWLLYKNMGAYKRMSHNKAYIVCTNAIFDEDEDVLEKIDHFIATDGNVEFQNKAKVLKLYVEMQKGNDVQALLESIDLNDLFYDNGKLNLQKVDWNSDTFCWTAAAMIKAHKLEKPEIIEGLLAKYSKYDFLNEHVEYALCKSVHDALLNKEDEGKDFLLKLIRGEYTGYKYDNRLIGLYKRMASAVLVYKNVELDEFERDDVYNLAKTKLGQLVLTDLDLFEEFDKKEDPDVEELEMDEAVEESEGEE